MNRVDALVSSTRFHMLQREIAQLCLVVTTIVGEETFNLKTTCFTALSANFLITKMKVTEGKLKLLYLSA